MINVSKEKTVLKEKTFWIYDKRNESIKTPVLKEY